MENENDSKSMSSNQSNKSTERNFEGHSFIKPSAKCDYPTTTDPDPTMDLDQEDDIDEHEDSFISPEDI